MTGDGLDRPRTPAAWDSELARLEEHIRHFVTHKPSATVGVAVDDTLKADYFRPRLQAILNRHPELKGLTVRLVPMVGTVTELRAAQP